MYTGDNITLMYRRLKILASNVSDKSIRHQHRNFIHKSPEYMMLVTDLKCRGQKMHIGDIFEMLIRKKKM